MLLKGINYVIILLLIIMSISGSNLNRGMGKEYNYSTYLLRDYITRDTICKSNEIKHELVIVINNNFYSSGKWISSDFSADSTKLINIIISEHPEIAEYGISHIEYSPVIRKPGKFLKPILLVTTNIPYYTMDDLIGRQYTALNSNNIYDLLLKDDSKFTLLESTVSYRGRNEVYFFSGVWRISKGKLNLFFSTGDTLQMDIISRRELRSHKTIMFNNKKIIFRYISDSNE